MPELPELVVIAEQMQQTLPGKEVASVTIFQPKCLNRPEEDYQRYLPGKRVLGARPLGKWVELAFQGGDRLLVNLGMGGEVCYFKKGEEPPEKSKWILTFTDGTGFFITLWWFGYMHLVRKGETHPMTDTLGPDPLAMAFDAFNKLLEGHRGSIKPFLLNQKCIRGIGNFYIQEILFQARLHPLKEIPCLSKEEKKRLFQAIRRVLEDSITLGSSSYELDFFGAKGRYGLDRMAVAYRGDGVCPVCGSKTEKIKTGSTAQFICIQCQQL